MKNYNLKNMVILMFCIVVIQIAAYYLAGMTIRSDGGMAIAQPDTLLYCQAARRIVEGFPFSFSCDSAVSTGTTSVAYPFVLAIPYLLGCTGDSLITAGFFLNAIFYILFVMGWGLIIHARFAGRDRLALLASVLVAAFGPTAYCALAQSDIGLWMAVSAFLAWGLLLDRKAVYAPLLVLSPWIRPEGMILVAAYGFVLVFFKFLHIERKNQGQTPTDYKISCRRGYKAEFAIFSLGLVSVCGVFLLNWLLTGNLQFSSVVNKGYFTRFPFAQALYATAIDGMEVVKGYILGMPSSMPRNLICIPVVGAVLLWAGVCGRNWKKESNWREGVWLLAMAGCFWTVSTSGWQDKNLDRYLAWTFPMLLLLMSEGCHFLQMHFERFRCINILEWFLILFTCTGSVVFANIFHFSADGADRCRAFAAQCEETMTLRSAIGTWGGCGMAYEFSPRRVAHLGGVYSPEFMSQNPIGAIEILKNEPKTRFWYYFYDNKDDPLIFGSAQNMILGDQLLIGPDGYELRRAQWAALDAAAQIPVPLKPGLSLCDKVDVGYEKDEREHGYDYLTNYHMPIFKPFVQSGRVESPGREGLSPMIVEGGRVIFGGDEMTVRARAGRDLYVVMRTYPQQKIAYDHDLSNSSFVYSFKSPMELHVEVDEEEVGHMTFPLSTNNFSDVSFVIPGKFVLADTVRVAFHGDHIACGYWFYQ